MLGLAKQTKEGREDRNRTSSDSGNTSFTGCEDDISVCGNSTGLVTLDGAGCEDDIKSFKNSASLIALDCAGCEDDNKLSENRTGSLALNGAGCEDDISVCGNSTGSVTEVETSSGLPGSGSYGKELVTSRLDICTREGNKLTACVYLYHFLGIFYVILGVRYRCYFPHSLKG